ncbi:hypothetical protein EMIT047CA2_20174 [Pseudomonas soli]
MVRLNVSARRIFLPENQSSPVVLIVSAAFVVEFHNNTSVADGAAAKGEGHARACR